MAVGSVVGAAVVGMAAIIEFIPQPHTSTICVHVLVCMRKHHSYDGGCAHALLTH